MPEGFDREVSDRVVAWAKAHGHTRLYERLVHFVGKARSNGYVYADWDEALMTAIREDWAKFNATSATSAKHDRRATAATSIFGGDNHAEPTAIDGTAERLG